MTKLAATPLPSAEDRVPDIPLHPKHTTPLVVVVTTGVLTLPDPTDKAIALNQQLAIKAITAHQKLYPKKLKKKDLMIQIRLPTHPIWSMWPWMSMSNPILNHFM